MHWELFNNPPTTPLGFYGHSPPLSPQADLFLQMEVEKVDVTYIKGSGPCSFAPARGVSLGEAWDGVLQGIFLLLRDTWRSRGIEIRTQQYWLTPYLLQLSLVCRHPVIFTRIYLVESIQLAVCLLYVCFSLFGSLLSTNTTSISKSISLWIPELAPIKVIFRTKILLSMISPPQTFPFECRLGGSPPQNWGR